MRLSFITKAIIIISALLAVVACSSDEKAAQQQLNNARQLYNDGYYAEAKQEVDSLRSLYPKAFKQINESFLLVDSIRRSENKLTIKQCDSLIAIYIPMIDSVKKYFVYQRDEKYQETGTFIPKEGYTGLQLTSTLLRSGVEEDGKLYIESVFVGGQTHNKLKVSTKDGLFAESLQVEGDGFIFRFSNLGKQYEVIKYTDPNENGIAKFVVANQDKPITATLSGQGNYSFTLPKTSKSSIVKAYELSVMMSQMDSLKTEKEKAQFRIMNLDQKKEKANTGTTPNTDSIPNIE
jgi:hypothetical protein